MTLEQKYKEQYEIGFPIFQKLFQLKKDDFIKVMKDIFQENKSVMEILENKPRVIKTLNDDEPEETYEIKVIDSCEYIYVSRRPWSGDFSLTHKGNCKYCAERSLK